MSAEPVTVLMMFTASLLTSCRTPPKIDRQASLEEIEKVVRASIGWDLTKDTNLLFQSVPRDSAFFIYHPDAASTIVGFTAFESLVNQVFMNETFRATGFSTRNLRINLSQWGEVAWYSALLDDHGEWQGEPISWVDTRWTGVLERRKGSWRIVQMHFSFAESGDNCGEETDPAS